MKKIMTRTQKSPCTGGEISGLRKQTKPSRNPAFGQALVGLLGHALENIAQLRCLGGSLGVFWKIGSAETSLRANATVEKPSRRILNRKKKNPAETTTTGFGCPASYSSSETQMSTAHPATQFECHLSREKPKRLPLERTERKKLMSKTNPAS